MTGVLEVGLGVAVTMYVAATFVLIALALHAALLAMLRLRHGPRALPEAAPPRGRAWPAVVVQIPVYDEPLPLVARALDAAVALGYPGPTEIQLLDDSPPAVQRQCAALCAERRTAGVRHRPRADRDGFKAGALAHGLRHTEAAFAAVFDVDFRPPPDTLRRLVPALLADDGLAFVQALWTHPEADQTALGRAQAAVLDLHFAVEQTGRDRAGLPITFNGTAGVWRVAAIEAAGGWQGDTLAEDLDLALRVQTAGWRARLVEGVRVPADLPPTVAAWRRQQARWAKGLAEVGRKHLGRVWRSGLPRRARAAASMMPALSLSLPSLLAVVLLHPVVGVAQAVGWGPPALYASLSAGYVALAGLVVAHAVAQRALDPASWRRRILWLPLVLAAPLALLVPATRAVAEAVRGRRSPFVRTLKRPEAVGEAATAEIALAAYTWVGAGALVAVGAWGALVFQGVLGAALVGAAVLARGVRRTPAGVEAQAVSRAAA
ncbi:MAG: glycosyltransferase family 2 protein [Bacteroidota bacterium]